MIGPRQREKKVTDEMMSEKKRQRNHLFPTMMHRFESVMPESSTRTWEERKIRTVPDSSQGK